MFYIKDHKTRYLFDPFEHLGPKRRKMLEESWAGVFREHVLSKLPVDLFAEIFSADNGRLSKELHAMLGVLILQQMFDYTDEETIRQFAFNLEWHYALNITDPSDFSAYICPKTLWNTRQRVLDLKLGDKIFDKVTAVLVKAFDVDTKNQRLDSMHIASNMRHLGRISVFVQTIKKFLVNLRRQHRSEFDRLDKELTGKYLDRKQEAAFSMVKPSESRQTLEMLAEDLFSLVERFKDDTDVTGMTSYHLMVRVLNEQCIVTQDTGAKGKKVTVLVKANKDVKASSLQNPSDPDAGYDKHKGRGYQVQLAETYSGQGGEKDSDGQLSLITYAAAEPAHHSDAKALEPMLDHVESQGHTPETLTADTAYGSDDNVAAARERGVELIAPTNSELRKEGANLDNFEFDDDYEVKKCPAGHAPCKINHNERKGRVSACFSFERCASCDKRDTCVTKPGKKGRYLRYRHKDVRLHRRRAYERTAEFREKYRYRAGIEATNSALARRTGIKRLRFRGLEKVDFCVKLKALGLNIIRAAAYKGKKGGKTPPFGPLSWLLMGLLLVKEQIFRRGLQIWNFLVSGPAAEVAA